MLRISNIFQNPHMWKTVSIATDIKLHASMPQHFQPIPPPNKGCLSVENIWGLQAINNCPKHMRYIQICNHWPGNRKTLFRHHDKQVTRPQCQIWTQTISIYFQFLMAKIKFQDNLTFAFTYKFYYQGEKPEAQWLWWEAIMGSTWFQSAIINILN